MADLRKTWAAWAVAILWLCVFELWTFVNKIPGDTLSEGVWAVVARRLIVPLIAGILCGHFFGQFGIYGWRPMIFFLIGIPLGVLAWQAAG